MKKTLIAIFILLYANITFAQTAPAAPAQQYTMPYGQVDKADLEMKACGFEKDANAEILFDKANVYQGYAGDVVWERHIRIKIFNDFGKKYGNVRVSDYTLNNKPLITDIEAETLNLENNKIVISKMDKAQIYTEKTDRFHATVTFSLPNVQSGSVIEYKYKWNVTGYPNWYFQSDIPTRYSEVKADLPPALGGIIRLIPHVQQPFITDIGKEGDYKQYKAMTDIHSLPDEAYMTARRDNAQRIDFVSQANSLATWEKIGEIILRVPSIEDQLDNPLSGEGEILKTAKKIKNDNERLAYIFDTVKNAMKWNDLLAFYAYDGAAKAWSKKVGNSAEINMALCRLLKKAGIKACLMLISTRKNGLINPYIPSVALFNSTIVCASVNSKQYVLDASNKYNLYNITPEDYLNTYGLPINEDDKWYKPVFFANEEPVMQSVFLNAEIKKDGKLDGTAEITSFGYNKTNTLRKYKTEGEAKYIAYLKNNDNGLKISSIKMEDISVDTLPLAQKIKFEYESKTTDDNYIFLTPNLFTFMGQNPFAPENRYSMIDFGYLNDFSVNGIYKLPAGYKTETLPKSIVMNMPDQSAVFRRVVAEDAGTVSIRYVLMRKKTIYLVNDYPDLRAFYQKMYELLNEQLVLKKS
jgi:hypothetical protein